MCVVCVSVGGFVCVISAAAQRRIRVREYGNVGSLDEQDKDTEEQQHLANLIRPIFYLF